MPLTIVILDIISPLQETKKGNKHIIRLVDYFTKWPEAKIIQNTSSEEFLFLIEVFSRHRPPEIIITDN